MYIGMRYGVLPAGLSRAQRLPPNRVVISVDIYMQGTVKQVESPTHPTVVLQDGASGVSRNAQYNSDDFLNQDFVLIVTAEGLDSPRCFAQRGPNGTVAMQLSMVPKFNLPFVPEQEYIFLVDRSGSMLGDRMEMAKRTLVMLLRALPAEGTSFNIFSFGTYCDALWSESSPYNEETLNRAVSKALGFLVECKFIVYSRRLDTSMKCWPTIWARRSRRPLRRYSIRAKPIHQLRSSCLLMER